jgi:leader peptidase (prepilin peptidase)/N-methyltransferase
VTAAWVLGCGLAGLLAGAALRGTVFAFSALPGSPPRVRCPGCGIQLWRPGLIRLSRPLPPSGRCPRCRGRIGPPAALLEVAIAVAFALVAVRFSPGPLALAFLWLAAVGVALSAIDLAVHRLPDALTLRSYPVMFGLLALAAATGAGGHRLVAALLGMAGLLALYLLLAVIPASAMGLGDV